jgi:hypothetical protein
MHKNPSMSITRPMPGIDRFLGLADSGRALKFVRNSEEIFKEVEVSGTAPVCSQITSVTNLDKVSVIAYSSRQVLGSSLTSGVVSNSSDKFPN